jgi:predicted RNase H-like HicB family nuclease
MFITGYRVGFPGWRLVAKLGVPMVVKIVVHKDKDSGTFWAEGQGLRGLVVTGKDLNELYSECTAAIDELMSLELDGYQPRSLEPRMAFPKAFMAV